MIEIKEMLCQIHLKCFKLNLPGFENLLGFTYTMLFSISVIARVPPEAISFVLDCFATLAMTNPTLLTVFKS